MDKDLFPVDGFRLQQLIKKVELLISERLADPGFDVGAYQGLVFGVSEKFVKYPQ